MSGVPLRSRLGYQGMLVGVAALLTSGALLTGSLFTGPEIERRQMSDLTALLREVLPGVKYENDLLKDTVTLRSGVGAAQTLVYRARSDGRVVAAIYQVSGLGYAGPIVMVMGVDRDGRILAVRVVSHRETPGLGDKIERRRDDWIDGFNGLTREHPDERGWAVKKDGGQFDQFSGATITPRGVVKGVKEGLELFAKNRGEILGE